MEKSFIDHAYDILKQNSEPLTFKELFDRILEVSKVSLSETELKRRMSQFYSQLTFDGRFALVENNKWDLSERRTYSETHRPISDINDDDDLQSDDAEEKELLEEELGISKSSDDKDDSSDGDSQDE